MINHDVTRKACSYLTPSQAVQVAAQLTAEDDDGWSYRVTRLGRYAVVDVLDTDGTNYCSDPAPEGALNRLTAAIEASQLPDSATQQDALDSIIYGDDE